MMAVAQSVAINVLPRVRCWRVNSSLICSMLADYDLRGLGVFRIDLGAEDWPGTAPIDRHDFAVCRVGGRILIVGARNRCALVNGEIQSVALGQKGFGVRALLPDQSAAVRIVRKSERRLVCAHIEGQL